MRCISPIWLRKLQIYVPCGVCNYCLAAKRADWSFRLYQEFKVCRTANFLTLTYDEDHLPFTENGLATLEKKHVQLFMKKLRKYEARTYGNRGVSLRYYTVGEYGTETKRPHYHSIMFNMQMQTLEQLSKIWGMGQIHRGEVTPASIHYTTKYCITRSALELHSRQKPFALISNRSGGLGKNYLSTSAFHKRNKETSVRYLDGVQRLPRYYRDKIFTTLVERDVDGETVLVAIKDKVALDAIARRSQLEVERREAAELERLSKLHPDPIGYMIEREMFNHEHMYDQLTKTEKL